MHIHVHGRRSERCDYFWPYKWRNEGGRVEILWHCIDTSPPTSSGAFSLPEIMLRGEKYSKKTQASFQIQWRRVQFSHFSSEDILRFLLGCHPRPSVHISCRPPAGPAASLTALQCGARKEQCLVVVEQITCFGNWNNPFIAGS